MSAIRCKLRCMSIDHRHDKSVVKLYAVTDGGGDEENKVFWKYTPSAELEMEKPKHSVPELFTPDKTYYVDMIQTGDVDVPTTAWADPVLWVQNWDIHITGVDSRSFVFSRRAFDSDWGKKHGHVAPFNGKLTMQVDNPRAYDILGLEGGKAWTFEFSKAPESYVLYVNGDHKVLRESAADVPVTYDAIVMASGIKGEVTMTKNQRLEDTPERVEREGFELSEYAFYVVTAV